MDSVLLTMLHNSIPRYPEYAYNYHVRSHLYRGHQPCFLGLETQRGALEGYTQGVAAHFVDGHLVEPSNSFHRKSFRRRSIGRRSLIFIDDRFVEINLVEIISVEVVSSKIISVVSIIRKGVVFLLIYLFIWENVLRCVICRLFIYK